MTRKGKGPDKNWGVKGMGWRKKILGASLKIKLQGNSIAPNRRLSLSSELTCNAFLILEFQTKRARAETKLIGHESPGI